MATTDTLVDDGETLPSPPPPAGTRVRAAGFVAARAYAGLAVVTLASGALLVGPVLDAPPGPADLEQVDVGISEWLVDQRSDELDSVTAVFSRLGDTEPVVAIAVLVALVGLLRRLDWRPLLLVLSALSVELLVFLTVTYTIARERPPVERLGSTPSTSSFPSGHSAAGIALWVAIALLVTWSAATRRWRTPAIVVGAAVGVAIGLSRLYRGMHFATDVVSGWMLGAAALLAALLVVEAALRGTPRVRHRRWIVEEPRATDPALARSHRRA